MTVHQSLAEWSSWGWPLFANHLWQATLLSIAAFAAAALLRNAPGRARYAIWLIASAKFVVPSALLVSIASRFGLNLSSLFVSTPETSDGFSVISQLTAPVVQFDQSISAGEVAARGHNELLCVLTIVWFTGCASLTALWWRRRQRFRGAMRSTPITGATRERQALSRVRSWLGIRRDVGLLVLPATIEPGVWGVWRPIVLLPESMGEELSEPELEAVMMHELIHVARWDNLAANLHRLLCCVLWFHPIVWVLDRLLLREREQACDEEVIRLSGASDVYASSLLKVLRFCLGWSVAGASNATGSNLGRRVERIMSGNVQVKLSVWHRAAVGSIAALVITLSMATGLLTREAVVAQSKRLSNNVSGGGVQGGATGENTGFAIVAGQDNLIERLDQAPLTPVDFKNSAKALLVITDARVKAVPRVQNEPGDEYAVVPVVAMVNNSDRRIKGFTLEFRNGLERRAYYERIPALIDRRAVYTSGAQKRFIILVGGAHGWTVRVAGVLFEDGDVWVWGDSSALPPPPPRPTSGELMRQLEEAPEVRIQFESGQGTPLSITSASARTVKANRVDPDGTEHYLMLPNIQLMNNTGKRVIVFGLVFADPDSWSKTYVERAQISIEPSGSYNFQVSGRDGAFTAVGLGGSPDRIVARVVGVKFEDGEAWGSLQALPPPPPRPQEALAPEPPRVLRTGDVIRKSSGVMMNSATHRVEAEYPPLARAARVSGAVVIEVTVDEAGVVTSARAISGHPLLKDSAVNAARQWQFTPTTLSGVRTRVVGTLTFNFEP